MTEQTPDDALTEITAALTHAKNTFYRYAELHRAKQTEDGDEKACTNAGLGEEMAQALDRIEALTRERDAARAEGVRIGLELADASFSDLTVKWEGDARGDAFVMASHRIRALIAATIAADAGDTP